MVDVSDNLFEFLHNDCLFNNPFDFSDSFIFVLDLNNLFIFLNNLFDSFDNDRNFNNLFNDFFNVSVDIDQLWKNSFNFNNLWNFNNYFLSSFNLVPFFNMTFLFTNSNLFLTTPF